MHFRGFSTSTIEALKFIVVIFNVFAGCNKRAFWSEQFYQYGRQTSEKFGGFILFCSLTCGIPLNS